jgi:hypothetical protein
MHYYDYLVRGLFPNLFHHAEDARPELLESEEWWLRHGHEHRLPVATCRHSEERRRLLPAIFWFWRLKGY